MTDNRPTIARQSAERRGRRAEWIAANWLRLKGYRIVRMRAKTPSGEIDIVARRGAIVAFVEVKRRATRDAAVLAVTPATRRRIERAARSLASSLGAQNHAWRFDLVLITPGRLPQHVPGAWLEAER